jgi:hypothetical protein
VQDSDPAPAETAADGGRTQEAETEDESRVEAESTADGAPPAAAASADDTDWWKQVWDEHSRRLIATQTKLNAARGSADALDAGSVAVLQRAIRPYFLVLREGLGRSDLAAPQRKRRAELILLGNLRLVAYEQTRLQPVFERNLSYLPNKIKDAFAKRAGRHVSLISSLKKPFGKIGNMASIANEAFQIAASRRVFSMLIGSEELTFGRDIPVPPPANPLLLDDQPETDRKRFRPGAFFSNELSALEDPMVWAEWQLYDRSNGSGGRTAVNDWLRYGERMSFIVNAFRSRQQLTGLYEVPGSKPAVRAPTKSALQLAPQLDLSRRTRNGLQDNFRA